ncbi:hypothetical protein PIB30_069489, partial [Stylosanthes scabra]|nr:hypothetical protein [Stylosanthes scabra]
MEPGRLLIGETGDEMMKHDSGGLACYLIQSQRRCVHLLLGEIAGCWLVVPPSRAIDTLGPRQRRQCSVKVLEVYFRGGPNPKNGFLLQETDGG